MTLCSTYRTEIFISTTLAGRYKGPDVDGNISSAMSLPNEFLEVAQDSVSQLRTKQLPGVGWPLPPPPKKRSCLDNHISRTNEKLNKSKAHVLTNERSNKSQCPWFAKWFHQVLNGNFLRSPQTKKPLCTSCPRQVGGIRAEFPFSLMEGGGSGKPLL